MAKRKREKYIVCQWVLGKCPMFHNLIFNTFEKAIDFVEQEKLFGRASVYELKAMSFTLKDYMKKKKEL